MPLRRPGRERIRQRHPHCRQSGQGAITAYGPLPASNSAMIDVDTTAGPPLLSGNGYQFTAGNQYSVFLVDNPADPSGYKVSLLQDQQIAAPAGHSSYRFLNQATNTGAVDVYMIPTGVKIADAVPLIAALPVNGAPAYVSFISKSCTMFITPTGVITPAYTSAPIALTGGDTASSSSSTPSSPAIPPSPSSPAAT